jgi:hypothetical protein
MTKRDEFDDPEGFFDRLITIKDPGRASIFENKSLVFSGVVFVIVVALSGVIWASYPSQNPLTADGTVPVIRADTTPYKVEPDDRGGMSIAHKDSTVFDAIRQNDQTERRVENLLEDQTETPIDRTQLFAGLKTERTMVDAAPEPETSGKPTQLAQASRLGDYAQDRPLTETERRERAAKQNQERLNQPAIPLPGDDAKQAAKPDGGRDDLLKPSEVKPAQTAKPSKGFQEPPQTAVTDAPASKPKDDPKGGAKPIVSATAIKTGVGNAFVQVASVPSEGLVKSEWASVSGKLSMLKGLPYRVQRADLGAKGVFHRLQVGPMSSEDAASLCAQIKAQKPGGCLVVR